jgi:hypothetical protein
MAIEEPKFQVVREDGDIQLRQYLSTIVAETSVSGKFDKAANEGFRRLAGYIFGGNEGSKKISMTAPVGQGPGEKIPMTAPVSQSETAAGEWNITFTMPSEFSLATLPKPNDARVVLKELPPKKFVVYRYSGTWSLKRFEENKIKTLEWIHKNSLSPNGEAIFARYNPPFTLWFLRRNEVLIQVD